MKRLSNKEVNKLIASKLGMRFTPDILASLVLDPYFIVDSSNKLPPNGVNTDNFDTILTLDGKVDQCKFVHQLGYSKTGFQLTASNTEEFADKIAEIIRQNNGLFSYLLAYQYLNSIPESKILSVESGIPLMLFRLGEFKVGVSEKLPIFSSLLNTEFTNICTLFKTVTKYYNEILVACDDTTMSVTTIDKLIEVAYSEKVYLCHFSELSDFKSKLKLIIELNGKESNIVTDAELAYKIYSKVKIANKVCVTK